MHILTKDTLELGWAVGLFEGEGCIHFVKRSDGRPILRLSSTDHDVVRRFRDIVGCGSLSVHRGVREGWKDSLVWHLGKADEILAVLAAFWPHLGDRRRDKATEAIERAAKVGEGPRAPFRYRESVTHHLMPDPGIGSDEMLRRTP